MGSMKKIDMYELRENADKWLRGVGEGECYEITFRGKVVARLGPPPPPPPPGNALEQLASEGLADLPPEEDISEIGERLGLPVEGGPISERLAELRRYER